MNKRYTIILIHLFWISEFSLLYSQCFHAEKKVVSEVSSPGFSELEKKYDVNFYHINLSVNNLDTYIEGYTDIAITAIEAIDTIVFELSDDMSVDSIEVNSEYHQYYVHSEGLINIIPENNIQIGEKAILRIYYKGASQDNSFYSGISNRSDFIYNKSVTYTLSEPFQASSWFPVKQDLLDKADSVRIYLTVDEHLMVGSNGILENISFPEDGKKTFEWFSEYPIAYYLISFSVADYIDYSFNVSIEGVEDSLLVQNFIYNSVNIWENEKEKIDKTGDLLELFSGLFGTYPFINEKYGHCMAPMGGGMEHQTMTTLQNFNFLLVAHELAHQWFGDYVTCSTWQDIWINEGFASYGEYLALEFLEGEEAAIEWMNYAHDLAMNAPTGSIFIPEEEAETPSRIFNFYLSYKKGAAIINMLRYELNDDDKFFQILRTFIDNYKNSVASGRDFLGVFNDISGDDYSWFFDQWYYGEGYPIFQLSYKSSDDTLYLESAQTGSGNIDFFKTHFDVKIFYENNQDTIIRLEQTESTNIFTIPISSKAISVQMDPFSRVLMNSSEYEFLPDPEVIAEFQNPFKDKLFLNFSDSNTEKEIVIYDLKGRIILHETIEPTGFYELNLDFLESGIYILTLIENSRKMIRKIQKL